MFKRRESEFEGIRIFFLFVRIVCLRFAIIVSSFVAVLGVVVVRNCMPWLLDTCHGGIYMIRDMTRDYFL